MNRQKRHYRILLIILWISFALRIYHLTGQSLWWDEMWTVALLQMPPSEMFSALLADRVHMPLYFVALRGWVSWLGLNTFGLRYFSVLAGFLAVPLVYRLGQRLIGRNVALLTAGLLAVSPFHIWFSQETRMYSLLALAPLLVNLLFWQALRSANWRAWAGYSLAMAVCVYIHYFSLFVLLAHYIFLSVYYRRFPDAFRRWLLAVIVPGVLFAGWVALTLRIGGYREASISWIAPAHWYEPLFTLLAFTAGPTIDPAQGWPYVALVAGMLGVGMVVWRYGGNGRNLTVLSDNTLVTHFLLVWLIAPLMLTWLISLDLPLPQKRSIYMDRYLIVSLPALLLLVAWGWELLAHKWPLLVWAGMASMLLPASLALANMYTHEAYMREDWRTAMGWLSETAEPEDMILLDAGQVLPLKVYGNGRLQTQTEILPILLEADKRDAFMQNEMPHLMHQLTRTTNQFWLVRSQDNTNPHGFPQARNQTIANIAQKDVYKQWLDTRYTIITEKTFTGIHLTQYQAEAEHEP
ncbi:MAG: hypothetical protein D6706_01750 [Chloroflexi bacterium]|nr:MAG: hypothetical protein D6706_01750 [Chloroflexota bacterium]